MTLKVVGVSQEVQLDAVLVQVRHKDEHDWQIRAMPLSNRPELQEQLPKGDGVRVRRWRGLQAVQEEDRPEEQLTQVEAQGWQVAVTPLS